VAAPHRGSAPTEMSKSSLTIIRENLQAYADRGVFRGFSETSTRRGTHNFTFTWLVPQPLELSVDTKSGILKFKNLLPNVPGGSALHSDLKSFLQERCNGALPRHRRIDKSRADLLCRNNSSSISIALKVKNNQYRYCLNRIVNLVHELFVHLNDAHVDYMRESFDAPQE
jgi:hypothetical protein